MRGIPRRRHDPRFFLANKLLRQKAGMVGAEPSEVPGIKKFQKFQEKVNKTGVIYLSRVPPFMRVEKIRHLLGMYGKIHRIYCVAEGKIAYYICSSIQALKM